MVSRIVKMTQHPHRIAIHEYVAGASLGLLVGTLLGLSTAPVVASLMTGLVALLAAFFGFGSKLLSNTEVTTQRLIAFSIATVVAALIGLSARTHDFLSPPSQSMKSVADDLKALNFPESKIQDYLGIKFFGVLPVGSTAVPKSKEPDVARTSFFAALGEDVCRKVAQRSGNTSDQLAFLEATNNLDLIALSKKVRSFRGERQAAALDAGLFLLCGDSQ